MNIHRLSSLASLATLFVVALLALTATADAQIYYSGAIRFYYVPAASYCYINEADSYKPLTCVAKPNLADAGIFTLEGINVPYPTYAESPTQPAILNGGALSKWCFPRNYTGKNNNNIYCSGSNITKWFQIIKVGGLGSNYIYNSDRVIVRSTLTNSNCTVISNVLNCDSSSAAGSEFTIVI
ncbi:hypothetical protein pmac_cds_57 [Pandoravirus macleodensis]|uniref:Uncharacterized protein n=1 Tax=Pandoravirus macleodensis TaxID=2107707 RepID=A0A2U7UEG6_9VIRU|nr:hypothetical protein pmac_cds_57 [Pandoravirus macleodensis]AVK76745.1 hypothetical protein pmac_cds_57 [Pandoravirus macleodensis]UMO79288.1 hypothetical protein [Pandoravirus aubagnensis]